VCVCVPYESQKEKAIMSLYRIDKLVYVTDMQYVQRGMNCTFKYNSGYIPSSKGLVL
jgi:hypothetical protein